MHHRQAVATPLSAFVASTSLSLTPTRGASRLCRGRAALSDGQQAALAGVSVVALPIVAWSEFVLATTGCGLPPGPGGLLGAAEGVSYLVVAGVVALSVREKVTTGSGLPAGPGGLLGAAEGVAYLLVLAGLADAAYVYFKYGSVPEAVPGEGSRCFPQE